MLWNHWEPFQFEIIIFCLKELLAWLQHEQKSIRLLSAGKILTAHTITTKNTIKQIKTPLLWLKMYLSLNWNTQDRPSPLTSHLPFPTWTHFKRTCTCTHLEWCTKASFIMKASEHTQRGREWSTVVPTACRDLEISSQNPHTHSELAPGCRTTTSISHGVSKPRTTVDTQSQKCRPWNITESHEAAAWRTHDTWNLFLLPHHQFGQNTDSDDLLLPGSASSRGGGVSEGSHWCQVQRRLAASLREDWSSVSEQTNVDS